MRRSQIQIEILGLSDLQNLNTALATHDRRVKSLTASYAALGAVAGTLNTGFRTVNNTFNQYNNTIDRSVNTTNNFRNSLQNANARSRDLFDTLIKYRAVSAVFSGVENAIHGVVTGMIEMEKQAARVARLSGSDSIVRNRSNFASEAARTGLPIAQIGEAAYQVAPFVKGAEAQLAALKAVDNMILGMEIDGREAARGLIAVYNTFADQLDKTANSTENLTRISNIYAIMLRETNTEVSEVTTSLKYLAPIAAATHAPLASILGIIGSLDKAGLRGSTAGTGGGAFLSQLVTRYQDKLPGRDYGGVIFKGKEFPFEAPRDPLTGGRDPIKMLEGVRAKIVELRKEGAAGQATADLMWKAISGSERAGRATGALISINSALSDAKTLADKVTNALHHTGTEAEDMANQMKTTAQQWERVWVGSIATISNALNASGLREYFKSMADWIERASVALGRMNTYEAEQAQGDRDLFRSTGPRSVIRTQQTVQQVLSNYRAGLPTNMYLQNDPTARYGRNNIPSFLLEGLNTPQREMIQGRYFHGAPQTWHDVLMAMTRDDRIMTEQQRSPMWNTFRQSGLPGAPQPFNPLGPNASLRSGGGTIGGDTYATELKKAEEAHRKLLEADKDRLAMAQAHYEVLSNELGVYDKQTIAAKNAVVEAERLKAVHENDPAGLYLMRHGRGQMDLQYEKDLDAEKKRRADELQDAKDKKKEREDAAREAREQVTDDAQTAYQIALKKYGVYDPRTKAAAHAAWQAEMRSPKDVNELMLLFNNVKGTGKDYADELKNAPPPLGLAGLEGLDVGAMIAGIQGQYAETLTQKSDLRIRGLERGMRPSNIFQDQDAARRTELQDEVAEIQKTIDALAKIPFATEPVTKELEQWRIRLLDANAALVNFSDELEAKAYQKRLQAADDAYALRVSDITHVHKLRFAKDEEGAYRNEVQKLSELVTNAQNLVESRKKEEGVGDEHVKRVQDAAVKLQESRQNLSDYQIDYKIQRYLNVYQNVKGTVRDSLQSFFHGQGSAGDVVKNVGDTIVTAALDQFIKKYTDPLTQTITSEILAIQGNTDALTLLTSTMGGGTSTFSTGGVTTGGSSPIAAAVAAGVASAFTAGPGMQDFGWGPVPNGASAGASRPGARAPSDLQKGIGAASAAYSIGSQSAEQGTNIGNLLGAAATGFMIGGPIGAGVGIAANLIGGLFHHRSKPTATPQDLSPAYYNAPANFDVAAYNYSAYGKLPKMQDVGFDVKAANTPIVNVYVDGAKVAARQEITRQTVLATVSLNSHAMDRHAPN